MHQGERANADHHEVERASMNRVLNILVEQGLEGMVGSVATMLNEAMKERSLKLTITEIQLEAFEAWGKRELNRRRT